MRSAILVLTVTVFNCSNGKPSQPDLNGMLLGLKSLAIDPAAETLTIVGTSPATAHYKAVGTFTDGRQKDVTTRIAFDVADPGLGMFVGNVFMLYVAPEVAQPAVIAQSGQVFTQGSLTIILQERVDTDEEALELRRAG